MALERFPVKVAMELGNLRTLVVRTSSSGRRAHLATGAGTVTAHPAAARAASPLPDRFRNLPRGRCGIREK